MVYFSLVIAVKHVLLNISSPLRLAICCTFTVSCTVLWARRWLSKEEYLFFGRGPRFESQHQCISSQSPVTPILGDLTLSSDLCGHQQCMWYIYTQAGRTLV